MPNGECATGEFRGLSYINEHTGRFRIPEFDAQIATAGLRSKLFLAGLERGNVTPFYSAINTIFVREHNRLCREMALRYPVWDDNRVFETARNTNIVQLLKIIVEDYINHLSSAHFRVFVEPGFAEKQNWYRANRIAAEFDLLYRWHPLIPTDAILKDKTYPAEELLFNNHPLIRLGIEEVIRAATTQRAGRVMLKNTAEFLSRADLATLEKSQDWRIRPYNEYRQRFDLPPVASFEELTDDRCLAAELRKIYGDVNRVELLVDLFAEKHENDAVLGSLMHWMVPADAFSQALTNPLLSENVYGEQTFSEVGMESIKRTSSFDDIVRRNTSIGNWKATFTAERVPPGGDGSTVFKVNLLFAPAIAAVRIHRSCAGQSDLRI